MEIWQHFSVPSNDGTLVAYVREPTMGSGIARLRTDDPVWREPNKVKYHGVIEFNADHFGCSPHRGFICGWKPDQSRAA